MIKLLIVKIKWFWFIPLPFILGAIALFFVLFPKTKLLSPLTEYVPNYQDKIRKNIAPPLIFELSGAKEVGTLGSVPHYLAFNLDTGRVYAAKAAADQIAPGSFTKLLMASVALDLGFPDELITATKTSVDKVPTVLELVPGEQLPLKELLRGAIATSANDAAATIAEGVASQTGLNLADFILLMNQKATLIGMKQSHFATPDGLDDPTQSTTLVDMAQLVNNVRINYPDIMKAAASDRIDIEKTNINGHHYLPNWNGLLNTYPGVFGLKIAYTENAGHGTIVLSERNGVKIAALVSGVDSDLERDMAAAALLDEGYIAEKIAPINLSRYTIKKHYQAWADLAKQIRQEQASGGGK